MSSLNNRIVQGDCLELLSKIDRDSVDLLLTDPPYGLSFMGKDWDKAVPSVEIWRECLRVLKAGAFAFIMCTPRQDGLCETIIRLKEAGFATSFTSLYWVYASGFPKAQNTSKVVDKKLKSVREGELRDGAGTRGNTFPLSPTYQTGPPISQDAKKLDGSFSGFQPKPALEPIIVAMKPLSEKTYVDQALKNGKGVTWLDDGRIPFINEEDREKTTIGYHLDRCQSNPEQEWGMRDINAGRASDEKGRFPANLLVSDDVLNDGMVTRSSGGSGESTKQSSDRTDIGYGFKRVDGASGLGGYSDSGSFSRYFDLDAWWDKKVRELPENVRKTFPFLIAPKASKGERNEGLKIDGSLVEAGNITARGNTNPVCQKCGGSKFNRGEGVCVCAEPKWRSINRGQANIHPTVKPLKLMSYLVTLGSRENDVVLDPFIGSGTTVMACKILNRKYIGAEINLEYFEIAEERIRKTYRIRSLGEIFS